MSYKKPTIKSNLACTFHRDDTVSYWDIYKQQWDRMNAGSIRSSVLSSLNDNERVRINNMIIIDKEEHDEWVTPTDEDALHRPMVQVRFIGEWRDAKLLAVTKTVNADRFVVSEGLYLRGKVETYVRCRMKASERNQHDG
jgi:hypothetical protein